MDIDVVIPTLNCADNLSTCLRRVLDQRYEGKIRVIIVDGGSTDGTIEIARQHGAEVYVNPGQYIAGLTGSRHYGELKATSALVWILDSDNFLLGHGVASQLASPFRADASINLSVPIPSVDETSATFNQWVTLVEREKLLEFARTGRPDGGWVKVTDLTHGISNATLIKREALLRAGGYDSDLRLLFRLRRLGLASAAIVPGAQFVHATAKSLSEFVRKQVRRVAHFATLSDNDLKNYFVDYPVPPSLHKSLVGTMRESVVLGPRDALLHYSTTKNKAWLWGLLYPLVALSISMADPKSSWRLWRRFF